MSKEPEKISRIRELAIEATTRIFEQKQDTGFMQKYPWHRRNICKFGEAYYRGFIDGALAVLSEAKETNCMVDVKELEKLFKPQRVSDEP